MKEKVKILIVEDEKILAIDLKKIVEKLGYEVCSIADSGKKALKKAEVEKPELILMDIMLNGELNGIDTSSIINSIKPVPVIYLSALNDDETFLDAMNVSDYGFISKPYDEIIIGETLEKAVIKSRMEKL